MRSPLVSSDIPSVAPFLRLPSAHSAAPATYLSVRAVRDWLEDPNNADSVPPPLPLYDFADFSRIQVDLIIFCVFSDRDREVYQEALQVFFPLTEAERAPPLVTFKAYPPPFPPPSLYVWHLTHETVEAEKKAKIFQILGQVFSNPPKYVDPPSLSLHVIPSFEPPPHVRRNIDELLTAIRRFEGNEKIDLTGLQLFFEGYISEETSKTFFTSTITILCQYALDFANSVTSLPFLPPFQDTIAQIDRLTIAQVRCVRVK